MFSASVPKLGGVYASPEVSFSRRVKAQQCPSPIVGWSKHKTAEIIRVFFIAVDVVVVI